jgi:4-amino-4-deoxy-L-arabinose transferase-like glycosyltransferase
MVVLRNSWMICIAAFVGTVLWFALLAGRPLYDPDEGRYAEIPREMLSGGDWVIPHLDGLTYLEKPPLQYWLTALSFRGFGENEFTARLCTGLAGYLSLATVFFVGVKLWGFDAGVKAVLLSLASTLFVLLGHQMTLDMLLCFCLTAGLGCFLLAQARGAACPHWRAWMLGCWAAIALAVLAKGLIGVLIPAATLGAYVLWQRDWRLARRLNLRWGPALCAATCAPWFILAARTDPRFLNFFIVREHFQRYLTPIEHRTEPWWFFLPVLAVGIMPWLPLAARALVAPLAGRVPRGQFDAARFLWVWCVFVVIFFSASDAKLIPYILPAIPALALLCACQNADDSRVSLLWGALLTLAGALGVLAYMGGLWDSAESRALLALARPVLAATCVLLLFGAAGCCVYALRGRPRAALASLSAAWFLGSGSILVAADATQGLFSAKDAALALRREAAPGDPIFAVQSYQQSLPFYLQRTVMLVDYRDEFDLGLTEEPERGIATLQQFKERWLSLSRGFAIMRPGTRDRLSALGVPQREIARSADRVIISRR